MPWRACTVAVEGPSALFIALWEGPSLTQCLFTQGELLCPLSNTKSKYIIYSYSMVPPLPLDGPSMTIVQALRRCRKGAIYGFSSPTIILLCQSLCRWPRARVGCPSMGSGASFFKEENLREKITLKGFAKNTLGYFLSLMCIQSKMFNY